MADSLCYRADANTLLWGNYTSIKMFEKKKIKYKIFRQEHFVLCDANYRIS